MSALTPKADTCSAKANVRFVPIADIREMTLQKQKDRLKTLAAQIGVPPRPCESVPRARANSSGRLYIVSIA
jgi:hypothetical protein